MVPNLDQKLGRVLLISFSKFPVISTVYNLVSNSLLVFFNVLKKASVLPFGDHVGPSVKYPSAISLSPVPFGLINPIKKFFL